MKQSIKLPRAPGRIKTFKPTGDGSRYSLEIVLTVTDKAYDEAVGETFAGYAGTVAAASMQKSASIKLVATKKPANVNLTIDDGTEKREEVLRKIDTSIKAPKLTIARDGAAAEMTIVVEVALTNDELVRVATYRGADAFFSLEPTQLDLEDTADAKPKKTRRRKADTTAPTPVQLSIVRQSALDDAERVERDAQLAREFGIEPERPEAETKPTIN